VGILCAKRNKLRIVHDAAGIGVFLKHPAMDGGYGKTNSGGG
jgi:hypothetical protein